MAYEYQVQIYCSCVICSHTSAQLNYDERHNRVQTVAHKRMVQMKCLVQWLEALQPHFQTFKSFKCCCQNIPGNLKIKHECCPYWTLEHMLLFFFFQSINNDLLIHVVLDLLKKPHKFTCTKYQLYSLWHYMGRWTRYCPS